MHHWTTPWGLLWDAFAQNNWTPPSALKHCPAPLHREHHTQTIVTKALTSPSHLLHDLVEQSNLLGQQRFKLRHPFSRHAARLLYSQFEICESWITAWQQVSLPARLNIAPNTALPPAAELPRKELVSLNHLRTGVGCFGVFKSWTDRPTPDGWVPQLLSTCGLEPLSSSALHKVVVTATRGYYIMLSQTRRRRMSGALLETASWWHKVFPIDCKKVFSSCWVSCYDVEYPRQ